jgi:hypothetical protein
LILCVHGVICGPVRGSVKLTQAFAFRRRQGKVGGTQPRT